jgi:outer membrane protein assembly factor BamB
MYRQGSDEVVLAASTATGKTIWEYRYNASFQRNLAMENGSGPHATPLVTENGVYAIGILANLLCLDKKTGKVIWSHDLLKEFKGTSMDRGYANSPIAYRENVILPVGGGGHAFMAFNQKTGRRGWKTAKGHGEWLLLAHSDSRGRPGSARLFHGLGRCGDRSRRWLVRLDLSAPHQLGTQHQHAGMG